MGRIQSSVGLITGVPITDTVDQLMALAAKPRDLLSTRNASFQAQQTAIGELTAMTIAIQLATNRLADPTVYEQRSVTSSDTALLKATIEDNPTPGTYQFTPIRVAQNHQVVSNGFTDADQTLGAGELRLGFGGFVDRAVSLDLLNGGKGIERGKVRITDRSGASAVIDLRFVASVDDVLAAINQDETINVRAAASGDAIQLTDLTGQTTSDLIVQEVGVGATAADLGLDGINVAANQATGQDVLGLFAGLQVAQLNDGNGLSIRDELADLDVTFRDGTSLQIDLARADVTTVGDLLDQLNATDPARLSAALSADADHLVLTDLTTDSGGTFSVSSAAGGSLAEDLHLTGAAVGDTLSSARLLSGLDDVLLGSLGGGQGLGTLGQLDLTDRSGASASVNVANAETLHEVIDTINAAGLALTADINAAGTGIELTDTSGATTSNLIVANGDATNSADTLGITVNAAQTSVDSGSLSLQVITEHTALQDLNNGRGVNRSSLTITDTNGQQSAVNLLTLDAQTVGDVLEAINGLGIGVTARINETGDGILLLDTAGGVGTMSVAEGGTGTTAADLRLLGNAETKSIDGVPTKVIDGAMTETLTIAADDTLADIVTQINTLDMGIRAALFDAGGGTAPVRLTLTSERTGSVGEMMIDASGLAAEFQSLVDAQDALLLTGSADSPGAGLMASSSTNSFDTIVDGLRLDVQAPSSESVTVNVTKADSGLVSAANMLVDQYNKLRDKLDEDTAFNEVDNTTGILFGSNEALRIDTSLGRLVTDRFFGAGSIESLAELGFNVGDTGQLTLDEAKFQQKFADDPQAVEQFFTTDTFGFADRMNAAIDSLAGADNSLLINRNEALQHSIEENAAKIDDWNTRLDKQRDQLLKQFYQMELAISRIQSNMSAINSLTSLAPLSSSSSG